MAWICKHNWSCTCVTAEIKTGNEERNVEGGREPWLVQDMMHDAAKCEQPGKAKSHLAFSSLPHPSIQGAVPESSHQVALSDEHSLVAGQNSWHWEESKGEMGTFEHP